MEASAILNWSPHSNVYGVYGRPETTEFIRRNLADGQNIEDLHPVQMHPELHKIYRGDRNLMPLFRNSRSSCRSGYTPQQCREIAAVHNKCRQEAIRLVDDLPAIRNAREVKMRRWAHRQVLVDLHTLDVADVLLDIGWFFQSHPNTSLSMRQALRYACHPTIGHHEQQRRHVIRMALQTNIANILNSASPWTVDVPVGFVLS